MKAVEILERDNWTCKICGSATPKGLRGTVHDLAPEIDHIVPRSRGGDDEDSNLRCACRRCNNIKLSLLDSEFKISERGEVTYDSAAFDAATRAIREGGAKGGRNGSRENKVRGGLLRKLAMDSDPEIRARCLAASSKGARNRNELYGVPQGNPDALQTYRASRTDEEKAEAGRILNLHATHEDHVRAGLRSAHVRWHVLRNIISPSCNHCAESDAQNQKSKNS
jgi:hypothetical protein